MKKAYLVLLSIIIGIFSSVGLTGCGDNENGTIFPDIANCEIGYQLPIYPTCEFDYRVTNGDDVYVIHIKSITMTLSAKNKITETTPIEGTYFPYTFRIKAEGSTTSDLSGKTVTLYVQDVISDSAYMASTIIEEDGTIVWDSEVGTTKLTSIQFHNLYLAIPPKP